MIVFFFLIRFLNADEFLEIKFGIMQIVTAVATQGRPDKDYWVTKYRLDYSLDGATLWMPYSIDKVFYIADN